jgi:putative polyhydroxyalkanoate system protein
MATIKVKRQHHLGPDQARDTVEKLAQKLQRDLEAEYHWEGSSLVFKRSGASGHIDVSDDRIELEVKLGMLLGPLKGKIQRTIEEEIDKYLIT